MQPVPTDRRTNDRNETTPRRTRLRLRELCDEVLASHRVARGEEALSEEDRVEAQALLADVAPLPSR